MSDNGDEVLSSNEEEADDCNDIENLITENEIQTCLEKLDLQSHEPRVLKLLSDYINQYTTSIINHALTFMKHTQQQTISTKDVKLAVKFVNKKFPKRRSRKELLKLAKKCNRNRFRNYNRNGLHLPTDNYTLSTNNKLRNNNVQYPINISMMNNTNRSQDITLNTLNNYSGRIPAIIHTPTGTVAVNMPLNMNAQRIIIKQVNPKENFRKKKLGEINK